MHSFQENKIMWYLYFVFTFLSIQRQYWKCRGFKTLCSGIQLCRKFWIGVQNKTLSQILLLGTSLSWTSKRIPILRIWTLPNVLDTSRSSDWTRTGYRRRWDNLNLFISADNLNFLLQKY